MNPLSQDIIQGWELESLPEIRQVEMIDRIGRILYQAILVRALDILTDKEQDQLDELLAEDDTKPQDVLGFLEARIPTFKQLVREEREHIKSLVRG